MTVPEGSIANKVCSKLIYTREFNCYIAVYSLSFCEHSYNSLLIVYYFK
jgi:hypothetical protein